MLHTLSLVLGKDLHLVQEQPIELFQLLECLANCSEVLVSSSTIFINRSDEAPCTIVSATSMAHLPTNVLHGIRQSLELPLVSFAPENSSSALSMYALRDQF